ncbi:hypothetical protein VTN00DRAFT_2439 [Thermoascus crustaceus]|uniref:uncharacterized protein n=1 Tax=Thermoascus crustaceus TaxID=5088 RepID=UPI0037421B0E
MDVPPPGEGDVNIGTDIFRGCWIITGIVGLVLIFRLFMKAWVRWSLPQVTAPERVWGVEDLIFFVGYSIDVLHMTLIQLSSNWGLGRHFFYLTPEEKVQALRFDYASQPTAVAAAMVSRAGMTWFLYQCFAASDLRLRLTIILCMMVQIIVNSVTIVQIVVQCGPHPYRPSDRTRYFHYMWDPLPKDGSVKCQDPSVQTTIGFVQGGFNTVIDFFLAVIAAFELWQFFIQTLKRNPDVSVWSQFRKLNSSMRSRRIWQTVTLSGPLILSGVASIVKTYLLKSLGDRLDFTYNIVSFILWVKIENYSILIATCAPVIRLFLRTFVDQRRESRGGRYFRSSSYSSHYNNREKKPSQSSGSTGMTVVEMADINKTDGNSNWDRRSSERTIQAQQSDPDIELTSAGHVTVKTDIVVRVHEEGSPSTSDGSPGSGSGSSERTKERFGYFLSRYSSTE